MTTIISIANGGFALNGTPTYPGRSWKGHPIEGLFPMDDEWRGRFEAWRESR